MAGRVLPADEDAFQVPVHTGADIRRAVAQRQTAAAAIRFVGVGAVQQQIAVERNLAGAELHVHRVPKLLGVFHHLVEHRVRVAVLRQPIGEVAVAL